MFWESIITPQRAFCVLGTNMKETTRTAEIVSPQRTFCVREAYDVQIQKIQNIQNIKNHTCLQNPCEIQTIQNIQKLK